MGDYPTIHKAKGIEVLEYRPKIFQNLCGFFSFFIIIAHLRIGKNYAAFFSVNTYYSP